MWNRPLTLTSRTVNSFSRKIPNTTFSEIPVYISKCQVFLISPAEFLPQKNLIFEKFVLLQENASALERCDTMTTILE